MPPRPRAIPDATQSPEILRAVRCANASNSLGKTPKNAAIDARISRRPGEAGGRRGSAPGRSGLTLSAHVPADSLDQRPASRMPSPSSALGSPASPRSFAVVTEHPKERPNPCGCGHAIAFTRSMHCSPSPAAKALDRTLNDGDSSQRGTGQLLNDIFSQRRAARRDPRTCSTCAASVALARGGRPFREDPGMARPRSGCVALNSKLINLFVTGMRGNVCGPRSMSGERGAPSADAPSRRRMRLVY